MSFATNRVHPRKTWRSFAIAAAGPDDSMAESTPLDASALGNSGASDTRAGGQDLRLHTNKTQSQRRPNTSTHDQHVEEDSDGGLRHAGHTMAVQGRLS